VRWHLSSSTTAEHRGRTPPAVIAEHKATWDYLKTIPVRLTIDKNSILQECDIHFEVLQEFHDTGTRGGRVHLGTVKLNLAQYTHLPADVAPDAVDEYDDGAGEGSITRRYLLQDSKINSTLKISIRMHQTEGDMNFIAPPLKSAMVAGGIAGVLTTEAGVLGGAGGGLGGSGEGDDIPSITSKTRELSEAQDIYRRTLAATWACQAGELAPDKLIENLFAGGDGGRPNSSHKTQSGGNPTMIGSNLGASGRDTSMNSGSSSDENQRRPGSSSSMHNSNNTSNHHGHGFHLPHPKSHSPRPFPAPRSLLTPQMAAAQTQPGRGGHRRTKSHESHPSTQTPLLSIQTPTPTMSSSPGFPPPSLLSTTSGVNTTAVSGRSSIEQQVQHSQTNSQGRRGDRSDVREYTEFELRDDLRSWTVRVR
jgi:hypothetical protein